MKNFINLINRASGARQFFLGLLASSQKLNIVFCLIDGKHKTTVSQSTSLQIQQHLSKGIYYLVIILSITKSIAFKLENGKQLLLLAGISA